MKRLTFAQVHDVARTLERVLCVDHAEHWADRIHRRNPQLARQFRAFAQDLRKGLHLPDDDGNTPRRKA